MARSVTSLTVARRASTYARAVATIASGPAATSGYFASLVARLDANNYLEVQVHASQLVARAFVAGSGANVTIPRAGERFVRIREAGSTIYLEASVDKASWTTITSQPDPFRLDDVTVTLQGAVTGTTTIADTIGWDDVGVP
jgi:hypothetical protein